MSRAEKYIEENTRNCSQLHYNSACTLRHWITPDQARKAMEIAREETIEKTLDFLKDKLYESGYIGIIDLCDEYIKTMKDE